MSERELRNFMETMDKVVVVDPVVAEVREALLADAPDVVGLLRWAYSQKREHEGEAREARKKSHGLLPEANELYWQIAHDEEGIVHTYSLVIEELEKVVRLTDEPPGWEWADDGFQNPEQWDKPECMP